MAELPIDFQQKAKIPPAVGGAGYPYRISARDLMADFVHAAIEIDDEEHESGLKLVETVTTGQGGHSGRKLALGGEVNGLPAATTEGDTVYYSGVENVWDILPASEFVGANEEFGIMSAEYGIPEWKKGKFIDFICYSEGVLKKIPVFCNDSPQPI